MEVSNRDPRSAETWLDAAYARFAADGLGAVRVEAIARDLGATKGSFYWHFADRPALVRAVMARWERCETDDIIAAAGTDGTPAERLGRLYETVGRSSARRRGEARLYAEAEREGVAEYVNRVSVRRIEHIASILVAAGVPADEARHRGVIALATAIGLDQLDAAGAAGAVGDAALIPTTLRMALAPS